MEKGRHGNTGKKAVAIVALIVVAAAILLSIYNGDKNKAYDRTETAMTTVVKFHLYVSGAEQYEKQAMQQLKACEDKLSYRKKDSAVAQFNALMAEQKAGINDITDEELREDTIVCQQVAKDSNGAFDLTIAPLAKLWNIEGEHPHVPDQKEIEKAKSLVGYERLEQGKEQIGTQVDYGAAGKGIACDILAKSLKKKKGAGTISIGGSIVCVGKKPGGENWKLGIQDPGKETGEIMGVLERSSDCFLSTSGDYEKYFYENGKRYHHILDTRTGYPAESGLHSVTVIAKNGLLSDALSTACFVLGMEEGKKLLEKYDADGIFIDENNKVYVTPALKSDFTIQAEEYTLVH